MRPEMDGWKSMNSREKTEKKHSMTPHCKQRNEKETDNERREKKYDSS